MELLERFASGDLEAFEALFRQHQKEVYSWIVRIVRDTGIAEDLTVETFWRIYQARSRFLPEGDFRAWARRYQRRFRPSPAFAPRNRLARGSPLCDRR